MSSKIIVTGATGFIGKAVFSWLNFASCDVVGVTRQRQCCDGKMAYIDSLTHLTSESAVLQNARAVIHCAARAHVMNDSATDPLEAFREANVGVACHVARQAAEAGARRFIFVSSIKVNGEYTPLDQPFTEKDISAPQDAYGISKMEAEQGLWAIARETGMEVVIIRPPLVYGPGAKGNFATLIGLVKKGLPLPFGAIHNKRSLVALDNLVDLIITCVDHPAAANELFLAGDGQDVSTTELLHGVGQAMGKPARLIPIPEGALRLVASLLGKKTVAQRLLGSLQVDISKARNVLGWKPPLSVEEGLRRCFVTERKH